MPDRNGSGRDADRADYSVSLLQAAAALYGADAIARLRGSSTDKPKLRRKFSE